MRRNSEEKSCNSPCSSRITRSFCGTECGRRCLPRAPHTTRRLCRSRHLHISGDPLQAATATTVRLEGKRLVQDAFTSRSNWGITILELPSLDAALDWAARLPPPRRLVRWKSGFHRKNTCAGSRDEWKQRAHRRWLASPTAAWAYLSSHTRDVTAEDALSNALVAAPTWPRDGVPQNPGRSLAAHDGANTSLINHVRHQQVEATRADSSPPSGRAQGSYSCRRSSQ